MANVKFFTQGNRFYIADKGGAVTCYKQVSAIADVLINICRSQNVPHGPNDSNLELVDKILEQCGGYGGDPNQARVTVKLGKMIDAPINTYHILRTETGEFHVLSLGKYGVEVSGKDRFWYVNNGYSYHHYASEYNIIKVAADAGIKKYFDLYNKISNGEDGTMSKDLHAQYNVYDVFCEIYDFINSRK